MKRAIKTFDAAEFLDAEEAQAEYIAAALETGDSALIREAIGDVIRARGMTEMAKATGLSRGSLYRAFGADGNPTLDSLLAVMDALGITLTTSTR